MSDDEAKPPATPTEASLATFAAVTDLKNEGNALFEANDFPAAVSKYTQAARLCTDAAVKAHPPLAALGSVVLTNRAATMLSLKQYVAAAGSAQQAEVLDPTSEPGGGK